MSCKGCLVFGGFFGGLAIWALIQDRRRIGAKRRRFAGREPVSLDGIYETFYGTSGLERESVLYYWKEVAGLLALDPRRLRPGDRLREELGPIEGKEFEDETEDLMDFLYLEGQEKGIAYEASGLCTLDDLIRIFATKPSGVISDENRTE